MISPDLTTFKRLARKGNVIALAETFPADLETPVSSFLKIAQGAQNAFLLESAEQEEKIGRFSFLGIEPEAIYEGTEKGVRITKKSKSRFIPKARMLDILDSELQKQVFANPKDLPAFHGGFVGYFSYENVQYFDKITLHTKTGPDFPLSIFFRVSDFLVFDHYRKTLSTVVLIRLSKGQNLEKAYRAGIQQMKKYRRRLERPLKAIRPSQKKKALALKSNLTRSQYEKSIRRIKEYIRAGDCIQVVFSQCFELRTEDKNDFQIYRSLRSINPSPYMFYFRSGRYRLIGSSPEMLVKKTGRIAELRPIAGTRRRGTTEIEDQKLEKQLRHSVKEMAEHLMLVDLGRNDLGRVSEFKSVKVERFAYVEKYSHVMHLVSRVFGRLKPGKTAADLLRATFPAGTVSGAPKIRAMQIINELEPTARGPYAGCLGYFGLDGNMDMCITIRTLMLNGKKIYLQAGGGIVKDSDPEREYEETVNKAKAVIKAIEARVFF